MRHIYAIGETIYDIIFRNNEPAAAKAGGSMLNTTVSLGRLGLPVSFISEIGEDHAGELINDFLIKNGVDTTFAYRYNGKTIIALAFLNEKNDASYSFYKHYPEERLLGGNPEFQEGDIVLFGAFYSLIHGVRQKLLSLLRAAREAGALLIYDPNMRSPHKDQIHSLQAMICENFRMADVVRGSDEDFMTMFSTGSGKEAYAILQEHGCRYLVYTKSNTGVEVHYPGGMIEVDVPQVKTISTIGAGDSFNAGLIYEFRRSAQKPDDLSPQDLKMMVETSISFGSHVCTHYDNYISEDFAKKFKHQSLK